MYYCMTVSVKSLYDFILFYYFRHIFVLTNTGDIMTFDFWQSSPVSQPEPAPKDWTNSVSHPAESAAKDWTNAVGHPARASPWRLNKFSLSSSLSQLLKTEQMQSLIQPNQLLKTEQMQYR